MALARIDLNQKAVLFATPNGGAAVIPCLSVPKTPLCVPKIRFCNIGGEGHRELGMT
jgi:hypothetical protein